MNEAESKIVPNSFQTPNAYVDEAMHLLTPEECIVLFFIDRHILGWQEKVMERKGVISLTMIVEGYQSKKTGRWFHGTGLSRPTVNKCLDALTCYGFIVPEGKPTTKGQTWVLGDYPDYDALRERQQENQKRINERMSKVRGKSDLPVNGTDGALVNVTTPEPTIYDLRKQRHLERQSSKTRKEKEELHISAVADAIYAPSNSDEMSAEEYCDWLNTPEPSVLEGNEKSAQDEKAPKRGKTKTETTTPLSPNSAQPPFPVTEAIVQPAAIVKEKPPRKPNPMAQLIDKMWGRAVSGPLLPMLMGNAQKNPWKEYNIEGGMTAIEIVAFTRWYRSSYPLVKMVPSSPSTVWGHVQSFRDSDVYERWMQEGEKMLPIYQPQTTAPTPATRSHATPEEMLAWKQQIKDLELDDVFGTLFDTALNQKDVS